MDPAKQYPSDLDPSFENMDMEEMVHAFNKQVLLYIFTTHVHYIYT